MSEMDTDYNSLHAYALDGDFPVANVLPDGRVGIRIYELRDHCILLDPDAALMDQARLIVEMAVISAKSWADDLAEHDDAPD
jgi:hypothetical protein